MKKILMLFVVSFSMSVQGQVYEDPNGSVGIGTSSPSNKLEVNGTIGVQDALVIQKGSTYRIALNGTDNAYINGRNSLSENKFSINSNGPSYLNGGFVGIGTIGPRTKLHVLGPLETHAGAINTFGNLSTENLVTSNTYRSFSGSTFTDGNSGSISRYISYRSIYGGYLNYNNEGHGFYSQGHYPRMFMEVISGNHGTISNLPSDSPIKSGYIYQQIKGPVASAATSPVKATNGNSQWLWGVTGSGNIVVAGKVESREVKVTVDAGADYVFKEGYDLKSLEEVQNYIKEHGHLPNIPSAKEMQENGIQLGEMNMKLLEKVEELTLYLFQIKQDQDSLKKENKELKAELIKLLKK
ncbi:hypothetical protein [Flagellimonas sp.]|uniref:hypothetical protein n=1 Tax=Flagellimonas sp. TaxID=2058762 RepID=UPI003BACED41